MTPQVTKIGVNDSACTVRPIASWVSTPARPPNAPPKPVTVPIARVGNTSAGSVMLPHAAWPNIAIVSRNSAIVALSTVGSRK